MRKLTSDEIAAFAARPNVRSVAVSNFLHTMGTKPHYAVLNAHSDARDYGWNAETILAISDGIYLAWSEE